MKLVGLAGIIAIIAVADGWWTGCNRIWKIHCCDPYNSETHVCCTEKGGGCCDNEEHLHPLPSCDNSTEPTYKADPCDCAKFYRCYKGELEHFTCPIRSIWDQFRGECEKLRRSPWRTCALYSYTSQRLSAVYGQYNLTAYNGVTNETVVSFVDLAPQDSVYNIMSYFAGNRNDFSFNATFNPIFWYSITCINGVCADYANDMTYWLFKMNGVASNIGVSHAIGKDGDKIMFVLTK